MGHRVLLLAGSLGFGGAERQLMHHAAGLAGVGCEVLVASATRGEHWEIALRTMGIDVAHIDAEARPARMLAIGHLARRYRPDVVQAAQAFMNLYAVGAARWSGARSVGALRSSPAETVRSLGRLGGLSLRAPDLLVGNARCHVRDAVDRYGVDAGSAAYLPNAIDPEKFAPINRGEQQGHPVQVLFAGRLGNEKRPLVFVESVRRVVENSGTREGLHFRIVGDGPDRFQVAAEIEAAGLQGVCEMAGNQTDMPAEFHNTDILVLTSCFEGTPNVVLEGMACGVAVVATAVGGVPDVMRHEVEGLQVPVDDPEATAGAIQRLIDDAPLRHTLGKAGARRVALEHAPAAVISELRRLHEGVIAGNPCAA